MGRKKDEAIVRIEDLEQNPTVRQIYPVEERGREKAIEEYFRDGEWLSPKAMTEIQRAGLGGEFLWYIKQVVHQKFLAGQLSIIEIGQAVGVWRALISDLHGLQKVGVEIHDSAEAGPSRQQLALAKYRRGEESS